MLSFTLRFCCQNLALVNDGPNRLTHKRRNVMKMNRNPRSIRLAPDWQMLPAPLRILQSAHDLSRAASTGNFARTALSAPVGAVAATGVKCVVSSLQCSEAVPAGLHNDEGAGQFGFSMGLKDCSQLCVRGLYCGWSDAQVDDALAQMTNEDQTAEIFVAGHEKPFLLTGAGQQISVRCSREAEFSGGHDVLAEVAEEAGGQCVNVLVEQESHEATLT